MSGGVDRAWLHEFASVVRLVALRNFTGRDTCIATTRLGLAVLDQAGVRARPQAVFASAMNLKAYHLAEQQVPVAQWPDDAWSVVIGPEGKPGGTGWDGHLVVMVREPGHPRTLIDLSADQFDRPQRDLIVGGPVFMDISGTWTPADPLTVPIRGEDGKTPTALVTYWPMPPGHPKTHTWKTAPDGLVPQEVFDEAAGKIIADIGRPPR